MVGPAKYEDTRVQVRASVSTASTSASRSSTPSGRRPSPREDETGWLGIKGLGDTYTGLWKAIIRPPRDNYAEAQLGPKSMMFEGKNFKRTDLQLQSRGLTLQCSHFEPVRSQRKREKLPCVVYLHGNSSSRCE